MCVGTDVVVKKTGNNRIVIEHHHTKTCDTQYNGVFPIDSKALLAF